MTAESRKPEVSGPPSFPKKTSMGIETGQADIPGPPFFLYDCLNGGNGGAQIMMKHVDDNGNPDGREAYLSLSASDATRLLRDLKGAGVEP